MSEEATYGFEESFQILVVAAVLQDPTFLPNYADVLLPNYFDFNYLSTIVRTAKELTDRFGQVPSKVTMVEEIKNFCVRFSVGAAEASEVLNHLDKIYATEVIDLDYVRTRVVEFGQRQSLRTAIMKIVTLFNDKTKRHEDVHEKAVSTLEAALRTGVDTRDLGLSLYPNFDKIPELVKGSVMSMGRKVPTGFATIDKMTEGGPGRGEVWVVMGEPGRGKSSFLVNLGAYALSNGLPVVHITVGDLKEVDVAVRYAARLTMTTQIDVRMGSDAYMRKASKAMQYDRHLFIKYYPSDTATMGHIRAYLSKLKSVENVSPALVILDYPEELKMPVENELYMSGGKNYSAMNKMAEEFDTLFWTASQVKDWKPEHKNDILRGKNMSESRKKFQKVDGACSWNMSDEEEMFGKARIWVDKTRRYKSFYVVNCDIDLDRMHIKEGKAPVDTVVPGKGSPPEWTGRD